METVVDEIITDKTISPAFQRAVYQTGWVTARATEIQQELTRGESKPFDELVLHFGDPQGFGQPPITSMRQFLACLLCPNCLDDPSYPVDVKEKARRILKAKRGCTISSYTDFVGLRLVREDVAKFISRRDGYPADPDDIILTNGGSIGIQIGVEALGTSSLNNRGRAGLMIPVPGFYQYTARSIDFKFYKIPYYLDEENNWNFNTSELKRALDEAKPHCTPRGLVLVNPGNPTGHVLTYNTIRDVIKFCAREKLVLFADEVYQETLFTNEAQFHSCKKVLRDLGHEYIKFQLMSIHSVSKGIYGECGLRGAYLELVAFSKEVKRQFRNKLTPHSCPSTIGQAALSAMCNPPQPGDESYEVFIKEKMAILDSYQRKAKITTSMLNSLEGMTCSEVTGALYAFPRVHLPRKAIEEAKLANCGPDEFYCWQMLEATGITPVCGYLFGQKEGTHHFRLTILPPEEKLVPMFDRISKFHKEFMDKYKDDNDNNKL